MTYRPEADLVEPADGYHDTYVREVRYRPSPTRVVERFVEFIFSLIELLILLRIVLLLVAARESNQIVAFVYNLSDIFVAPFRGILSLNEVQSGATALDVSAIVALIGWVIIEFIILAVVRMFRPAATV